MERWGSAGDGCQMQQVGPAWKEAVGCVEPETADFNWNDIGTNLCELLEVRRVFLQIALEFVTQVFL